MFKKLQFSWRNDWFHTLFLLANVATLSLFAYVLYARSAADLPGEEAMLFYWLRNGKTEGLPFNMSLPPIIAYRYLGIRSVMVFQMAGSTLAIMGAMGVNYLILKRLKLPKATALACAALLNLLLIRNTELHYLSAFAFPGYPLRVFSGFIFIYILAIYTPKDSTPPFWLSAVLGLALGILAFVHPILVLPCLAMSGILSFLFLLRWQFGAAPLRRWALQCLMFLALPGLVGVLVALRSTDPEMRVPRDTIRPLYFFYNDLYPKDIPGFLNFVLMQSKEMFFRVCFPIAWVKWGQAHTVLSWIPLLLFAIGTLTSFSRRSEVRFVLAAFIVADLVLRLAINLQGAFPYGGTQRYALSQVFGFSILISLGAIDIVVALARVASSNYLGTIGRVFSAVRLSYSWSAVVLILGVYAGALKAADATKSTSATRQDQNEVVADFGHRENEVYVVDDTSFFMMDYYNGESLDRRNQVVIIPKMFFGRSITPAEMTKLKKAISGTTKFQTITRVVFDEANFREAFRAVDERFKEVSQRRLLGFSFSRWELKSDAESGGVGSQPKPLPQ